MNTGKEKQETSVLIKNNFKTLKVPTAEFRKLVKTICGKFDISSAAVSINIVDDDGIRTVNKKFLHRSGTTDCISFDLSDSGKTSGPKIFDIVVNGQMAVREAKQRGHSSEAELALYITHGLLHNMGFNDLRIKDAQKMHKSEDEILQQFGYGAVYNKQTNAK